MSAGDTYAAFENAISVRAGWPQLNCSAMVCGPSEVWTRGECVIAR